MAYTHVSMHSFFLVAKFCSKEALQAQLCCSLCWKMAAQQQIVAQDALVRSKAPSIVVATAKAHTALAKKIPRPQKTGNAQQDQELETQRELFMQLIDHCIWDGKHILPLYGALTHRLSSAGQPQGDGYFKKIGQVMNLEEDWIMACIVKNSEFTVEDLTAAKQCDAEACFFVV